MSTSTASFTVVENVVQPMRDGTLLRADLYLPEGDGPFPSLVERTPYSKDNSSEVQAGSPAYFAVRGYAVLIQDVRGRFASQGKFLPFHDDGWGPTATATTPSNGSRPSLGVTAMWARWAVPIPARPNTGWRLHARPI